MKTTTLAWRYLWAQPLTTLLNLCLLSLGLASITLVLLAGAQVSKAFERDLAGIDAVVGAKGSPMQLILSGVFHLDVPTGNVPLAAVQALEKNPQLARVIPVSLGDNVQGFRIVGTTAQYPALYGAQLAQGTLWNQPMQAVLGSQVARQTGLKVGSTFAGSHGLAGGHAHEDKRYVVTGVLAATGTVLDRLVLTASESVWQVHEDHDHAQDEHAREVTLALIQYRTPLAAATFPRWVNTHTPMQAAAPAAELTRLLSMVGVGLDVLRALSGVLLLTAGLGVFIALWSTVRERRSDLAVLRMLGASPHKIASLLLYQGLWLALVAALLGVAVGQGLTALLGYQLQLEQSVLINAWAFPAELAYVPALALLVALAASVLPVVAAYRVSAFDLLRVR